LALWQILVLGQLARAGDTSDQNNKGGAANMLVRIILSRYCLPGLAVVFAG
jgi:hypothetical protein